MSVRLGLLAILTECACYGHQLRAEFDRRTGAGGPLNVGQVYSTLDRLERDGFVRRGETDADGLQRWHVTPAGSAVVSDWLRSPTVRAGVGRDDLAVKVALAISLPRVDAVATIDTELLNARAAAAQDTGPGETTLLPPAVMVSAAREHAEADIRWLERVRAQLLASPELLSGTSISDERPRRGRPVGAAAG